MSWRGRTLIIEPSLLRVRAVVLRCPISLRTLGSRNSRQEALNYCRREGYSFMEPVKVSLAQLEERI